MALGIATFTNKQERKKVLNKSDKIEWTDEMDQIIVDAVKEKGVVKDGLEYAAELFGHRSYFNCRNRWYTKRLSKNLAENDLKFKRKHLNTKDSIFSMTKFAEVTEYVDNDILASINKIGRFVTKIVGEEQSLRSKLEQALVEKAELQQKCDELEEQYKSVLRVINQARLIAVKEEVSETSNKKFVMEQNGNLVQVEN
jgi:hypothetical protein